MKAFLSILLLNAALAMAQGPSFQNRQRATDTIGIAPGQTARLHVLYPTAPAPIAQVLCSVTLSIFDNQQKILKTQIVSGLIPGKTVSVDVNADTDLAGSPRTEIYGISIAANSCNVVTSLELIDNVTQRTVFVAGSHQTFPFPPSSTSAASTVGQLVTPADPSVRQ